MRRDVGILLARADLLAFSSGWEGLSIAALEALATGTPIVTTPVEGMQVLLGDQRAGLIAPEMSPDALATAIGALAADPGRRAAMAAAGPGLVRASFSVEAMLDAYEALYASKGEAGASSCR